MAKKQAKKKKVPADIAARLDEVVKGLLERLGDEDAFGLFAEYAEDLTGYEDELIQSLSQTRQPRILNFFYRLAEKTPDRSRQKRLRKAIYSLEQSGVSADEAVRPKKKPVIQAPPPLSPLCYLSGYEPTRGLRTGLLALPAAAGRYYTAVFMCSHSEGMVEFSGGSFTETQVRRLMPQVGELSEVGLIKVSAPAVRYVMSEACAVSRRLGLPFDEREYEGFMAHAGGKIPLPRQPVIYDHISTDGLSERIDIPAAAVRLFDHVLFNGLRLGQELFPYIAKMDQAETSVLVLSESQKIARRAGIVEEAERDLFTPEKKVRLKRQLEENAYLLFLLDEPSLAEDALASALDIPLEDDDVAGHPFIRMLTMRSIGLFTGREQAPESDPPGRERSLSHSGLILPTPLEEER